MKLTRNRAKSYFNKTFLLTLILWGFFIFSIMKLLLVILNKPILLFLIYSLSCFLFYFYYYFNSKERLSFWKYILSYVFICLIVYLFNKTYISLILISSESSDDIIFKIIFASSLVPVILLFFVGNRIMKIPETE